MRLPKHVHVRQWDLHAWFGIVVALLFYPMAFCGSVTLLRPAVEAWEEPAAQGLHTEQQLYAAIGQTLDALEQPKRVTFKWPTHASGPIKVLGPGGDRTLDVATGELVQRRSGIAALVLDLHYWALKPIRVVGPKIAGLIAVGVLVVLVSGLLIQLKNLVKQFHRFRPAKPFRFAASDLHKVLGVVGLPFQALYAYTAVLMIFVGFALPISRRTAFDGHRDVAEATAQAPRFQAPTDAGPPAQMLPPAKLVELAKQHVTGLDVFRLEFVDYGRATAHVNMSGLLPSGNEEHLVLAATDGAVLHAAGQKSAFQTGNVWATSLHVAHYGGWPLRLLSFVLGLCTCVTILTGNWIWLERRDPERKVLGNRVLERLTLALACGLLIALASAMLSNRVLPFDMQGRQKFELLAFYGAWFGASVWALLVKDVARTWKRQLRVAALVFVVLPLLSLRVSDAGLFGGSPVPEIVGIEIGQLLLAGGLAFVASRIRGSRRVRGVTEAANDSLQSGRLA